MGLLEQAFALTDDIDPSELRLVPLPEQVWTVKDHVHTGGSGHDIAVLARNKANAQELIVQVIQQAHHDCKCEVCERIRTSGILESVELVRVR